VTWGAKGGEDHLRLPPEAIRGRGVALHQAGRGGDVTYHGPGQLVGYPILDLKVRKPNITWYMRQLEEVLIRTLKDFEISAERIPEYTGVWVGEKKIASLGVRMSRFVTMHGFCLNVCNDLTHYAGIIPCGISHLGVTSIEESIAPAPTLLVVKERLIDRFREIFAFT
jgi:lipoyl(octanoyl) transferase